MKIDLEEIYARDLHHITDSFEMKRPAQNV